MIITMLLNPLLSAMAIIPAVYLLIRIYKLDRIEKEPTRLLVILVLLGIASTIPTIVTETIGMYIVDALFSASSVLYRIIECFIVVALSEEGFKYLFLKKATWRNRNFNCTFDAVVYATFVSLGFALAENVKYVFSYGIGTALIRAVTAIPGHACFGVLMGAYYGIAKRYEACGNMTQAKTYEKYALIAPIVAHGIYDFIAMSGSSIASIAFFVYVAFLFSRVLKLIKKLSQEDTYI